MVAHFLLFPPEKLPRAFHTKAQSHRPITALAFLLATVVKIQLQENQGKAVSGRLFSGLFWEMGDLTLVWTPGVCMRVKDIAYFDESGSTTRGS